MSNKQTSFFLTLSFLALSKENSLGRTIELGNKIILEAFDSSKNKHDIFKLVSTIRIIINITMTIFIHFGGIFLFLDEQTKQKIYSSSNTEKINEKYSLSSLDSFFFDNLIQLHSNSNRDNVVDTWHEFIIAPLFGGNNVLKEEIKRKESKKSSATNQMLLFNEEILDEVKARLCHMLTDVNNFYDVFMKLEVPKFSLDHYLSK